MSMFIPRKDFREVMLNFILVWFSGRGILGSLICAIFMLRELNYHDQKIRDIQKH